MNMIGFIFLTYRRQVQKELSAYDITFQQERILKYLAERVYFYPSEIAELIFCDRPTASVVIKNMEKKNWVKKSKDSENGKQVKVTLTSIGRKKVIMLKKSLKNLPDQVYNPAECFSENEQAQFEELLIKYWNYIKTCS